jgi:hypothetical protein
VTTGERAFPVVLHESWLPREHRSHRPRHSARQRAALICAVIFFLLPAAAFALGVRPESFENRRLANFPDLASGLGTFPALNQWATDHLPLRNAGIRAEDLISRGLFGEPPPYIQGGLVPQGPVAPLADPASTTGPSEPRHGYTKVIEGKDGWLYLGDDVRAKCEPAAPIDQTLALLQRLRAAVETSGRTFVLVVAPDKTTVLPRHLPDNYVGRNCALAATEDLWRRLAAEPGALDTRARLRALDSRGLSIYYPLDTHWTEASALDVVRAIGERVTPGISGTWTSGDGAARRSPGDLAALLGRSGSNVGRAYTLAPDGVFDLTRPDIGDLTKVTRVRSLPVNGMITEPVAVIGDSFSIPLSRYLPAAFSDLRVLGYSMLNTNREDLVSAMVESRIVVVEIAERSLAAGTNPLLETGAVGVIKAAMDNNPVR